jgi:arabinan endo-1,5-alpha-L-arabinosidase
MNKNNIAKLVVLTLFSVTLSGCLSSKERIGEEVSRFGPWIHDPSALQFEDGYFMTFSSGYRTDYTSRKTIQGLGINSWYRDSEMDTWCLSDIFFTGSDKPKWWDELIPNQGGFWAPDIPSKWVMYYSFEADNDSASVIGRAVATGEAPNLKWKDDGIVLLMPNCRRGDYTCPVAIDPSVFTDDEGNLYMAYGSGTSGIWIVELDSRTGHLGAEASEGWSEDNEAFHHVAYRDTKIDYIEAPCVYRHPSNGYYYLFVNWGGCCRGLKSTYNIRVGRSRSPVGPFLDKSGKDMVDEGGSVVIETEGRYIGPGHAGIYRHTDGRYAFSFHYYDGADEGKARIAVRNLTWVDDWPVVGETEFFQTRQKQ